MSKEELLEQLCNVIAEVNYDSLAGKLDEAIRSAVPVSRIVESLTRGLRIVGERYQKGDYYLAELITAGSMMTLAMKNLEPMMGTETKNVIGKVVIGTVQGDMHDIGKNIVALLLKAEGFQAYDLGVDVRADDFVGKIVEVKADILGLSALITTTMPEMRRVVRQLDQRKIRNDVKVIVGGAPITEGFAKDIGADRYGGDAVSGVAMCRQWMIKS